jgi:cardiolipin synthase A/B
MLLVKPPAGNSPGRRPRLRRAVLLLVGPLLAACGASTSAARASLSSPLPYPATAGPPLRVGADTVRILPRGATAYPLILQLVAGARTSVHVEMYEFARDDLADALAAARHRGVEVVVVDDPSVDVTRATATRLRARDVDVLDYPVRSGMIDHVKLLVVDSSVAVVGGINWGTSSDRNHDVDAELTGPAATALEHVFLADVATCGRPAQQQTSLQPDPAILVAATLPGADIRPLALRLIDSARQTLDLELYVLTDTGVVHAIERARERGVRVRVLLDPSERPSDGPAAELAAAGVDVRLYRGHGEKLHAKLGVADGRDSLFGSANWTSGGFERNHELDIEIPDSTDVATELRAMVDADWSASAP